MAERHDYSVITADILIQLQSHGAELQRQSEIQTRILALREAVNRPRPTSTPRPR